MARRALAASSSTPSADRSSPTRGRTRPVCPNLGARTDCDLHADCTRDDLTVTRTQAGRSLFTIPTPRAMAKMQPHAS
jgi:hypothetical protein